MSSKKAAKNTIFSWAGLFVNNILSFILRTFLIKYLGTEILGVNATITETLNLLSMMELGIQTSITYRMYKPIIDNDFDRQRELINLYKIAYRIIGLGILAVGLLVAPFIPRIVNSGIDIGIVYGAYFLQLGVIVLNYFVSYYKLVYVVYQRQYIISVFNILLNIFLFGFQLCVLILTRDYLLYITSGYISLFCTYLYFRLKARKEYSEIIKSGRTRKEDITRLIKDTKEMVVGQVSGYIYGSTDNILISYLFGSLLTGYISNYRMITGFMRNMLSYAGNAISPTWGDYLYRETDKKRVAEYYKATIFLEYCLGVFLLTPTVLLIDDFIYKIWLHNTSFMISPIIYYLIIGDIFISFLGMPNCLIMQNLGMFKEEKKVSILGMITNIVASIALARLVGVQGIFWGTLLAVFVYWIGRSRVVNQYLFGGDIRQYTIYWIENLLYIIVFFVLCIGLTFIIRTFSLENVIIDFLTKGIIIEIVCFMFLLIAWGRTARFKICLEKFKAVFHK